MLLTGLMLLANPSSLPPVEQTLERFRTDPVSFAQQAPEKSSNPVLNLNKTLVNDEIKKGCRLRMFPEIGHKEAPRRNDLAENLVDNKFEMERSLLQMEKRGLQQSYLQQLPWSDSYWPLSKGALAARYQDHYFSLTDDWKDLFDYVQTWSAQDLIADGRASELSPAEKYDLMMGDEKGSLTKKMWSEGAQYFYRYGDVEKWMGLCHGWAAASFMLPDPLKAVVVTDPTGEHKFPLTISDIKGLGTLLFSNGRVPTRFVGGRCNVKDPDQVDHRTIDPDCRDTNPATWHLSVVNQIALAQRSFVMDATYDYEVWNQPVVGYRYHYYHPHTKMMASSVESGKVMRTDFQHDPRRDFRARDAVAVIGIVMDVTYAIENQASVSSWRRPLTRTVRYLYDLELNAEDKIVGGEWYHKNYPDFLWVPEIGVRPMTSGEQLFRAWSPGEKLDATMKSVIEFNSQRGLPVGSVVEQIFDMSLE